MRRDPKCLQHQAQLNKSTQSRTTTRYRRKIVLLLAYVFTELVLVLANAITTHAVEDEVRVLVGGDTY